MKNGRELFFKSEPYKKNKICWNKIGSLGAEKLNFKQKQKASDRNPAKMQMKTPKSMGCNHLVVFFYLFLIVLVAVSFRFLILLLLRDFGSSCIAM